MYGLPGMAGAIWRTGIAGLVLIYGFLFGVGKLVLMDYASGVALLALGLAGGSFIYFDLSRRGWSSVAE
jgi:SSS family solute:Na+ symporter